MNGRTPITNSAAAVRVVRVMKSAFVVSAILFLFVVLDVPSKTAQPPVPAIEISITVIALANVALGFVLPRYFLRIGQRASRNAQQSTPIQRWFTANVVRFALLESCTLFGVMLHFMGAALRHSEFLIAVGIVATVFLSLGALPGEGGDLPQS
jgi:hypothetical protein